MSDMAREELPRRPLSYLTALLSCPIVPKCCQWPAWLGINYWIKDYSNFTREVEVVHTRTGSFLRADSQDCCFIAFWTMD